MPVDALRKQWAARGAGAPLHRFMTFDGGDLVLGAGTKLVVADNGSPSPEGETSPANEARVVALLSAAHRRPVTPSALAHIRCALVKQSEGKEALALTHLALTGLPRLSDIEENARRLFMADGLMKEGVGPKTILRALELDESLLDEMERAYDPDQPRVPAGNGQASGQWTSGETSEGPPADPTRADDTSTDSNRAIQIADDSSNWTQYLNPIGEAEAAEATRPPFNGRAPNDQHQKGVDDAKAAYVARGFEIASAGPIYVNIVGFAGPRVYDFAVRDPATGIITGVEVKTTLGNTIYLDRSQVEKDAALIETPGGIDVPSLKGNISEVAYEAFCVRCSYINVRSWYLVYLLWRAGGLITFHPHANGGPPI